MVAFPCAAITTARINVLKNELTVTLRIKYSTDESDAVLDEAHELRRLYETEMPVAVTVTPYVRQLSLLPAADAAEHAEQSADASDWVPRVPDDPPPAADVNDRPTGETLDDFLSGGAA